MAVLSPSTAVLGLSGDVALGLRSLSSDGNIMVLGVTSGRSVGLGAIFFSWGTESVVAQLYIRRQSNTILRQG